MEDITEHYASPRRAYLKNSKGTIVLDFCTVCNRTLINHGYQHDLDHQLADVSLLNKVICKPQKDSAK